MNAWERQGALARSTTVWAAASIAAGVVCATRSDRWWRGFGHQHLGWGAVDLGIVAVATTLQARRMRRLANPYEPGALEQERRWLRKVLLINMAADAAYVAGGAALWLGRREHPYAAGAGAAIMIQGAFLFLHDAYHAVRSHA